MTSRNRVHRFCTAVCVLIALLWLNSSAIAAEPSASASPSPSASPEVTLTQSVSELSAQRAAAERSQIYRAGVDYSRWLDQVAKNSGSAFLQRPVYDRITWMRLLTCLATLALLALLTGWFLWIVRRRAGLLQSEQEQSWLAVGGSAIRKTPAPFVLGVWG